MTIVFTHENETIADVKPGECFKVDNYSVYLMTASNGLEDMTSKIAVNLLTGMVKEFPLKAEVVIVDAEVTVK